LSEPAARVPAAAHDRRRALAPDLASDLVLAALGGVLLLAWDAGGLDLPAARLFCDGSGFAWRDHWLLRDVLHDGARSVAWLLAALLALSLRWPVGLLRTLTRREHAWWLFATLAGAALVPLIKQHSLTSCPWDLAEFGGRARYVSHWALGVADGGGGHCFPSGHATTAFALLSGWFVLRRAHPVLARRWLLGVGLAGLLLGLVQLMRGAHYPSHTLWSGWLCFTFNALAAPLLGRARDSSDTAGAGDRPPAEEAGAAPAR
jgi:membrane-associated PAP2 superfamily phosphatase